MLSWALSSATRSLPSCIRTALLQALMPSSEKASWGLCRPLLSTGSTLKSTTLVYMFMQSADIGSNHPSGLPPKFHLSWAMFLLLPPSHNSSSLMTVQTQTQKRLEMITSHAAPPPSYLEYVGIIVVASALLLSPCASSRSHTSTKSFLMPA